MGRQQQADAREKSIAEFVGMVLIVAVLMAYFVKHFLQNEPSYQEVSLDVTFSQFASQVVSIHSQWYLEQQPETMAIIEKAVDGSTLNKRWITLNKKGWPDVKSAERPCADIWQLVMAQPLLVRNTPVSAVQVKFNTEPNMIGKICRFYLTNQRYFEYNSGNGEVSKAN